jgi:hypothetical protein
MEYDEGIEEMVIEFDLCCDADPVYPAVSEVSPCNIRAAWTCPPAISISLLSRRGFHYTCVSASRISQIASETYFEHGVANTFPIGRFQSRCDERGEHRLIYIFSGLDTFALM